MKNPQNIRSLSDLRAGDQATKARGPNNRISAAIENQEKAIAALHESISNMENRLTPVLEAVDNPGELGGIPPIGCLADAIDNHSNKITQAGSRLRSILDRLHL